MIRNESLPSEGGKVVNYASVSAFLESIAALAARGPKLINLVLFRCLEECLSRRVSGIARLPCLQLGREKRGRFYPPALLCNPSEAWLLKNGFSLAENVARSHQSPASVKPIGDVGPLGRLLSCCRPFTWLGCSAHVVLMWVPSLSFDSLPQPASRYG